jgi:AP2-associated kinase
MHLGMATGASSAPGNNVNIAKTRAATDSNAGLVAVDLPGQPTLRMTAAEKDDYLRDFQKRFPSLTSIEMVERDLAAEAEGESNAGRGR